MIELLTYCITGDWSQAPLSINPVLYPRCLVELSSPLSSHSTDQLTTLPKFWEKTGYSESSSHLFAHLVLTTFCRFCSSNIFCTQAFGAFRCPCWIGINAFWVRNDLQSTLHQPRLNAELHRNTLSFFQPFGTDDSGLANIVQGINSMVDRFNANKICLSSRAVDLQAIQGAFCRDLYGQSMLRPDQICDSIPACVGIV